MSRVVQDVFIETQPLLGKKGRLPGKLIFRVEKGKDVMEWQPCAEHSSRASSQYAVKANMADVRSFRRRGPRLVVVLQSGTTLLPFYSDHFDDLGRFLEKFCIKSGDKPSSPPTSPSAIRNSRQLETLDTLGFSSVKSWFTNKFQDHFDLLVADSDTVTPALESEASADSAPVRRNTDELLCRARSDLGDLGTFDVLSTMTTCLPPKKEYSRSPPVSREQWQGWFSEGHVVNEAALREAIFHGGVSAAIRREVWLFFLDHRGDEEFYAERRRLYAVMKLQWSSLTRTQLDSSSFLRDRANRVAKDVDRTDRDLGFYDQPHLKILNDILMTYTQYDFDLGYVQGMNDILSVILILMDGDEVDAFWCFVGLMNHIKGNFEMDQLSMTTQLAGVGRLLRFLDPDLMEHFERQHSGDMFFCFRWLLILFKREFAVGTLWPVWETLFTNWLCGDYMQFLCVAVLQIHRDALRALGFEDILKFVNELGGTLQPDLVLSAAFSLWQRFASSSDIPPELQNLRVTWIHRQQAAAYAPASSQPAAQLGCSVFLEDAATSAEDGVRDTKHFALPLCRLQ